MNTVGTSGLPSIESILNVYSSIEWNKISFLLNLSKIVEYDTGEIPTINISKDACKLEIKKFKKSIGDLLIHIESIESELDTTLNSICCWKQLHKKECNCNEIMDITHMRQVLLYYKKNEEEITLIKE